MQPKVTTADLAGKYPGVVTVDSQPVRPDVGSPTGFDEGSMMSVTVGVLSCRAEDAR